MGGIGDCYWFSVAPSFPLVSTDTKLVWHYFILLHTHSCVHRLSSAMDVNDMLDDLQVRNLRNNRRRRGPPVINRRVDPTENLSDAEFKRNFRFDKENVQRLTELLHDELARPTRRGRPLTPSQQVCITLNYLAGAPFKRTAALCGGVSYSACWWAIQRVTHALGQHKVEFMRMPNHEEMSATARRMYERFGLQRFAFAIDGMLVRFDGAPRSIPRGLVLQDYWCRKQFYALNCQVICNDRRLILDLDVGWHGSAHDARVWRRSLAKRHSWALNIFLFLPIAGSRT